MMDNKCILITIFDHTYPLIDLKTETDLAFKTLSNIMLLH